MWLSQQVRCSDKRQRCCSPTCKRELKPRCYRPVQASPAAELSILHLDGEDVLRT